MFCPSTIGKNAALTAANSSWTSARRRPPFASIRLGKLSYAAQKVNSYPDISAPNREDAGDACLPSGYGSQTTFSTSIGDLDIKPISIDQLQKTAELLTEAYFQTYNLMPYKRYLYQQIKKYLQNHMQLADSTILAAVLPAVAGSNIDLSLSSSNPDKNVENVLVGTAELSFSPSTRTPYRGLEPPDDCAFLCNMAVAPEFRRKGVATCMLKAAILAAGSRDVYLHVRCQDVGASQLYERNGFTVVKIDSFLVTLFGKDRKKLMVRPCESS